MATIADLPRLSASSLSQALLTAQEAAAAGDSTIAIIDVRDDDHIGGHIKGSQNVPSRTLDTVLPDLVRQLEDKETVVFHCALSQQRGPAAALRYIRERDRVLAAKKAAEQASAAAAAAGGEDKGNTAAADSDAGEEKAEKKQQQVFVLDRGFVGWQEMHGLDERLTDGYRKELWKDGYWM